MNNLVLFPDDSREEANAELNAPVRKNGVSRLMRDLREWHRSKEEFPCIEGVPLDDNIFEWHCNICPDSGDFKDVVFHLIILFDESYPVKPPRVKLCTTIPHPNVFGDWICLDMIERFDVGKKYQGWSPGYSVTSILMQLQSFLFEQSNVDQMEFHDVNNAARIFDPVLFNRVYMPEIKRFVCDKCGHCYSKPFPVTVSIANKQKKKQKMNKKQKHNGDCDNGGIVGYNYNNNHEASIASVKKSKKNKQKKKGKNKQEQKKGKNKVLKSNFCFWDGIYRDLEITIFGFFNLKDLMKIKRVAKRFQYLVHNTKIIQKDSIKCWFHRSLTLPTKELKSKAANKDKYNDDDMSMLCLGFGATPTYFEDESKSTTLKGQIFGNDLICDEIGHLSMIPSIDTTFDLLSSDAFVNFNIRKTVFNDRQFTHFIPLYLNDKHGKKAMKTMDKFILKIWNKDSKKQVIKGCHPWLKLYTIANMMKSLIVSVMKESDDNDGSISLHYSVNILEAFFRLHHTLIGIYFHHKKEISRLVQHQIKMFFRKQKGDYPYRSKTFIPDFGVFLSYFTLFEDRKARTWEEIAYQLLDETFTRQSKWILNAHSGLIDSNYCPMRERVLFRWKTSKISNRLFMFNSFFFRECCQLGNQNISLEDQFKLYNENFGFPSDDGLAFKLQKFVKKLYCDVKDYSQFFEMVGVPYPGMKELGLWFLDCMSNSEYRGYHKRYLYVPKGKMDARKRALQQQKKKEWLRQQQLEREESRQEYIKEQQRKKRELLQEEQRKRREKAKKNQRKQNNIPIEAVFTYREANGRTGTGNRELKLKEIKYWREYVRVCVVISPECRDEVSSVDEMYFDAIDAKPKIAVLTDNNEMIPALREALTDMYNQSATGDNNTMSRNDFIQFMYRCNVNDAEANGEADTLFEIVGNGINNVAKLEHFLEFYREMCRDRLTIAWWDISMFGYGYDLKKHDDIGAAGANILHQENVEEKQVNRHYPDVVQDGDIKINVKQEANGIYFADFAVSQLLNRFENDFSNIRARIVGKMVNGKKFECKAFTPNQQRRRKEYSFKQDKQLEEKLKQWQQEKLQLKLKLEATGQRKRARRSKYETTGVKVAVGAQIMAGGFGSELLPVVQFSFSTVKASRVSHNVRYIAPDCHIVRVLIKIVSGNIRSFDGVFFDGEPAEEKQEKQEKGKETQKVKTSNWAIPKTTMNTKKKEDKTSFDVRGPIDNAGLVYYSDVPIKALLSRFGEKLGKGISPRVKGATVRGNKFYCCGGDEYIVRCKSEQEIEQEQKAQNETETQSAPATQSRSQSHFVPHQSQQSGLAQNQSQLHNYHVHGLQHRPAKAPQEYFTSQLQGGTFKQPYAGGINAQGVSYPGSAPKSQQIVSHINNYNNNHNANLNIDGGTIGNVKMNPSNSMMNGKNKLTVGHGKSDGLHINCKGTKRRHHRGKRKNEKVILKKQMNKKVKGKRKRKRNTKNKQKGQNEETKVVTSQVSKENAKISNNNENDENKEKKKRRRRRKRKNSIEISSGSWSGKNVSGDRDDKNVEDQKQKRRRRRKKSKNDDEEINSVSTDKTDNDRIMETSEEDAVLELEAEIKRLKGEIEKLSNISERGNGKRHHRGRKRKRKN